MTSLLPGLREVRAPLATGFVWLVVAWLAFADSIARPDARPGGVLGDVYELAGGVGHAATLAAATFAAYVVGVLSVEATAFALPVLRILRRRRVVGEGLRPGHATPSPAGRDALREAAMDQLVRRSESDPDLARKLEQTRTTCAEQRSLDDPAVRRALLGVRIDDESYAAEVEGDLPLMPLRMLAQDHTDEIFGEFDRLRAEAEFRACVAVPLAALLVVIAWQASPWALLGLVAPAYLVIEAKRNVAAAADVLAEYVRACPSESPVLTHMVQGALRERGNWLEVAAERGYAGAMVLLAGRLAATDDAAAERWYRRAAEQGEGSAALWLASRLYRQDDPAASEWYARAADAGEPTAVAIREAEGTADAAEVCDLKLAHAGDAEAMTRLGDRWMGHKQDEAVEWYRRAAQGGHPPAIEAYASHLDSQGKHAIAAHWRRRLHQKAETSTAAPVES